MIDQRHPERRLCVCRPDSNQQGIGHCGSRCPHANPQRRKIEIGRNIARIGLDHRFETLGSVRELLLLHINCSQVCSCCIVGWLHRQSSLKARTCAHHILAHQQYATPQILGHWVIRQLAFKHCNSLQRAVQIALLEFATDQRHVRIATLIGC